MQYQAICFDFDYTLGDSTVPITIGYQRGLTAMGWPEPTVEQVRPTIGYTLQDGYTMLTGDGDQVRRDEFYHRFQAAVGELALQNGDATMVRGSCWRPSGRPVCRWPSSAPSWGPPSMLFWSTTAWLAW